MYRKIVLRYQKLKILFVLILVLSTPRIKLFTVHQTIRVLPTLSTCRIDHFVFHCIIYIGVASVLLVQNHMYCRGLFIILPRVGIQYLQ